MVTIMKLYKITYSMYACMGIISLGIFYIWMTYLEGRLFFIYRLFSLSTILLMLYSILSEKRTINYYCSWLILFLLLVLSNIIFYRNHISELIYIFKIFFIPIFMVYYILLPSRGKYSIFLKFNKLFALILLPSIIIWILLLTYNLPYSLILPEHEGKLLGGFIYRCYFHISVVLMHISSTLPVGRLCGLFDEPGVIGTISSLLLAANRFSFTSKKNIIILVAGLLSFSTAFYILLSLLIFFKILKQAKFTIVFFLPILVFSYFVFINLPITFPPLERVQNAISFTDGKLQGNNRESSEAKVELDNIYKTKKLDLLLGYGYESIKYNPKLYGSWSIRLFIYERGFISTLIFCLLFFIAAWYANGGLRFNWDQGVLILAFLLSLYQRPDALYSIAYLIIWAGGIANCKDHQSPNAVPPVVLSNICYSKHKADAMNS